MLKVPDASGDEDDSVLVAAVQGVLVSQGPARVRDCFHTRLTRLFNGVSPGEGEESIAGHN